MKKTELVQKIEKVVEKVATKKTIELVKVSDYLKMNVVNPDCQRSVAWTGEKVTSFYQTLTSNGIVPSIAIAELAMIKYLVDGKQRTTALKAIIKFIEKRIEDATFAKDEKSIEKWSNELEKVLNFELPLITEKVELLSEVDRLFQSLNNGEPLSKIQIAKASFSPNVKKLLEVVSNHEFTTMLYSKLEKSDIQSEAIKNIDRLSAFIVNAQICPSNVCTSEPTIKKSLETIVVENSDMTTIIAEVNKKLDKVNQLLSNYQSEDDIKILAKFSQFNVLVMLYQTFGNDDISISNVIRALKHLFTLDGKKIDINNGSIKVKVGDDIISWSECFGGGSSNGTKATKARSMILNKVARQAEKQSKEKTEINSNDTTEIAQGIVDIMNNKAV